MVAITKKLEQLRALMKEKKISAYIVPSDDPHQSEYVAPRWKSREWISGFTGSAGTVVITATEAGLWTDGRYFLQAEEQLKGSTITLFKMGLPETVSYMDWIASKAGKKAVVSFDASVMSVRSVEAMKEFFTPKNITVQPGDDLIGKIWKDRPAFPSQKALLHPVEFSGKSTSEKLAGLRAEMKKNGVDYHLFAALDDIAWLYNIRGKDIECNPVTMCFALVGMKTADLFIKKNKVAKKETTELGKQGVTIKEYDKIYEALKGLTSGKVFIDPERVSQSLLDAVSKKAKVVYGTNMTQIMKAVKNECEINGIKEAHRLDGIAMAKFLYWLDTTIGKEEITEISASDKLEEIRKEVGGSSFVGLSFETISGYGRHGAIIHYSATPETNATLKPEGLYLVDSGAQYLCGTTDITRTVALGHLTEEMKRAFTLVLKGHIRLAMIQFPQGFTTGGHIDAIARMALWQHGLNYNHGTGHGVGAYLNVHEGPMSISPRGTTTKIVPGMVMSNEPGYYEPEKFGIRIENLVLSVPREETQWGKFVGFENLTLCPIDRRAINVMFLDYDEVQYLDEYHRHVYETLAPSLTKEEAEWLKDMTRPLV